MRFIASLIIVVCLLAPIITNAEPKDRSPLDYSLKQYGLTLGVALLGGFVAWYSKVRRGEIPMWSINHLVGELSTSALAGLLCFWICEWANFPPLLTGALTGICGHMGPRAVTMFEQFAERKFSNAQPPSDKT